MSFKRAGQVSCSRIYARTMQTDEMLFQITCFVSNNFNLFLLQQLLLFPVIFYLFNCLCIASLFPMALFVSGRLLCFLQFVWFPIVFYFFNSYFCLLYAVFLQCLICFNNLLCFHYLPLPTPACSFLNGFSFSESFFYFQTPICCQSLL